MTQANPGRKFNRANVAARTPDEAKVPAEPVEAALPDSQPGDLDDGTNYVRSQGFEDLEADEAAATEAAEALADAEVDLAAEAAAAEAAYAEEVGAANPEGLKAAADAARAKRNAATVAAAFAAAAAQRARAARAVSRSAAATVVSSSWWSQFKRRAAGARDRAARIRSAFGLSSESSDEAAIKALATAVVAVAVFCLLPATMVVEDGGEVVIGIWASLFATLAVTTLLRGVLPTLVDIVAGTFGTAEFVAYVIIDTLAWLFSRVGRAVGVA